LNRRRISLVALCLAFSGGGFFLGKADGTSKAGSTNSTSIASLRTLLEPLEGTGVSGDVSTECMLGRNSEKGDSFRTPKLTVRLPDNFDTKELKASLAKAGWTESRSRQVGGDLSFSLSPNVVLSISAGVATMVVGNTSC
jgi:hypothetical protein